MFYCAAVDLDFTPSEDAFRAECRAWLEANVPSETLPSGDTADGFARHLEWERRLYDAGWAVPSWPKAYGGREATLVEWCIFEEEYYRLGAPQRVTQNGIFLLAPTLFAFGTDDQKQRILRKMASGEETWAQGWSEPGAGSDLAGVRSRAERVDGGWRLYGQKTWCTRASFCDRLFGLFRTDPDSERHRGLTYLMAPLRAEGCDVRGFGRLDGDEGFAEVFYDGTFVPDEDIIGDVGQGWKVAMATTSSERGLSLRSPGRFVATAARLVDLYRERPDPTHADAVVDGWMAAEAYRLSTWRTVTRMMDGEAIGSAASLNKLFWSEMDVELHRTALALLGPDAALENDWSKGWQFALAGPIYAGTNEIQRDIVARRVLDLPR